MRREEEKSLFLHKAVAMKLRDNPELLAETRRRAEDILAKYPERSAHYREKWREMLFGPDAEILSFLQSKTQEAIDMRQCSPFTGILSTKERMSLLTEFYERYRAQKNPMKNLKE